MNKKINKIINDNYFTFYYCFSLDYPQSIPVFQTKDSTHLPSLRLFFNFVRNWNFCFLNQMKTARQYDMYVCMHVENLNFDFILFYFKSNRTKKLIILKIIKQKTKTSGQTVYNSTRTRCRIPAHWTLQSKFCWIKLRRKKKTEKILLNDFVL